MDAITKRKIRQFFNLERQITKEMFNIKKNEEEIIKSKNKLKQLSVALAYNNIFSTSKQEIKNYRKYIKQLKDRLKSRKKRLSIKYIYKYQINLEDVKNSI